MKKLHAKTGKFCLYFIALILSPIIVAAQKTWDGGGDGINWNSANNWNPNGVPGAGDVVLLNTNTTFTILNVPTKNIGKLQVTGTTNVTLKPNTSGNRTLTVTTAATDAILIDAGATLTIAGRDNGSNDRRLTLTTSNTTGLEAAINGTIRVALDVAGQPNTYGVFTKGGANAVIRLNSTGTYIHDVNGTAIPTAIWNTAANCNITGVTSTVPGGLDQSFGNFSWNCPNQTTAIDFDGELTTVGGDFTIGNTNNSVSLVTSNNSTYTLNIGGNLVVDDATWLSITNGDNITATVNVDGNFIMSGATSTSTYFDFHIASGGSVTLNKIILNVAGNFSQSGGMFDFAYGSSNAANFTELHIDGDFSVTGTAIMTTSTSDNSIANGTITFNKSGTQTFSASTPANISYTNFTIVNNSRLQLLSNIQLSSIGTAVWGGHLTINNGGILDAGTNQVVSSSGASPGSNNEFILNPGGSLITANTDGVQNGTTGTVSTSLATRTFSSAANFTYNASAIQNSGTFTTTPHANQVNNLTINNSAGNTTTGVSLEQPITVAGTLSLQSGHITTTSNLLTMDAGSAVAGANYTSRISGGSDNSFVNGPMRKNGNTAFLFPIGKVNAGHRYTGISAPALPGDAFTAEFIRASAAGLGSVSAPGLYHVSACEYWDLSRTSGTSSVNVTLSWSGNSNCNTAAYVTDLTSIVVAQFGTSWGNFNNNGGNTGIVSNGSVTWNNVSAFGYFALGSNSALTNPLPVKFSSVKAYTDGTDNKIEWINETEEDVERYELQRSGDGIDFSTIHILTPRSNTGGRASYNEVDRAVNQQTFFYRIKAIEKSGLLKYSSIVKVNREQVNNFTIYPNPVKNKTIVVQLNSDRSENYVIRVINQAGLQVYSTSWQHTAGNASRTVELPASITPGFYIVNISGVGKKWSTKLVVQ